jgi:hypothetical protein
MAGSYAEAVIRPGPFSANPALNSSEKLLSRQITTHQYKRNVITQHLGLNEG